jgi:hypothetical protein
VDEAAVEGHGVLRSDAFGVYGYSWPPRPSEGSDLGIPCPGAEGSAENALEGARGALSGIGKEAIRSQSES